MIRNNLQGLFVSAVLVLLLLPVPAMAQTSEALDGTEPSVPESEFKRIEFVFEPDAYYTNVELILSLTSAPVPKVGEKTESEIYRMLISSAAVLPQFLVVEASINPLPYMGVYLKKNHEAFYDRAELSGSFNWVQAATAGFEEPYALSVLAGNVIGFDLPGSTDITGNGYSGYLFSAGNYHIKNNTLIRDRWEEIEWKIKGDRKSPVKKLSWSFRLGAKFHGHPDIKDIVYLSFRRSRLDYRPELQSLFNNSGFEYTLDLDRRSSTPMRHYFYVDKKWPVQSRQMALTLALGFIWESAGKYTGELDSGEGKNIQFILRPNIEF